MKNKIVLWFLFFILLTFAACGNGAVNTEKEAIALGSSLLEAHFELSNNVAYTAYDLGDYWKIIVQPNSDHENLQGSGLYVLIHKESKTAIEYGVED